MPQSTVNISLTVATPGCLITPIVKVAAGKSIQQIFADVKELAGMAKENKLKLDEFQGGTFTMVVSATQIKMPSLFPTTEEGTIVDKGD